MKFPDLIGGEGGKGSIYALTASESILTAVTGLNPSRPPPLQKKKRREEKTLIRTHGYRHGRRPRDPRGRWLSRKGGQALGPPFGGFSGRTEYRGVDRAYG